jgi:ATP-binding cassette, subfamily F, member 3
MSEIAVNNISKIFTYEYVLNGVTFEIGKGERVGLIGRNGTGKTTLFNIITGREHKIGDIGSVVIRKGAVVGCLDQIPVYTDEIILRTILHEPFQNLYSIQREMESLEKQLETEFDNKELIKKYEDLQHSFESQGGYEIDTRIKWICVGLKINDELLNKSFNLLSGGEKTRVTLASILLMEPDVLLLDEPTNHLDMDSVEWLEEFLRKFNGASLIITHDRYFIDRVINKIVVLENGKITKFNSNYSNYALEMKNRQIAALNEYDKLQKEIRKMQKDLNTSIARNAKNHSAFMSAKIRQLTAELQEKEKLGKPKDSKNIGLRLDADRKSSKIVLRMQNVSHSYGENKVLDDIDLFIQKQEKVAIVGPNGCGKSTLIKLMMEQINPGSGLIAIEGEVYVGAGIRAGYLDQELEFPNPKLTILEELCRALRIKEGPARTILARFLFYTNDIDKKISIISGGEKTRLKLAILMHHDINALVLDEPTNHLDIQSRELLEEVVNEFQGSVIIISHDRYFINKIAQKIVLMNRGKIRIFEGNYDFFRNALEAEKLLQKPKEKIQHLDYELGKKQRNKEVKRKRKLEEIEKQLETLEKELKEKNEEQFHFPTDYEKLQSIQLEETLLQKQIDELYDLWTQLHE